MKYRPFLSHKRENETPVLHLKRELCQRGAGGWKDTDDIPLGARTDSTIRRAINDETGGFIWWGTRMSLGSPYVCKVEVPEALKRNKSDDQYPFVPLFVDLSPGADAKTLRKAFGWRRAKALRDANGLVRSSRESLTEFGTRAARCYVKDLVGGLPRGEVRVLVTAFRAPSGEHDLTLDWRGLFDPATRTLTDGSLATIRETLADICAALQGRSAAPRLRVELNLPLPLAALVGFEWRRTTQMRLTLTQRTPAGLLVVEDRPPAPGDWPELRRHAFDRSGPHVLAVSVGKDLGDTVLRYADEVAAQQAVHLHAPGDLDPDGVRALAGWTVTRMARLNSYGVEKHLLLLGPVTLAGLIGVGANGTGRTEVPAWNAAAGYTAGVLLG